MRRALPFLVPWVCGLALASTLDDMDLRSNVEAGIRGIAGTATLHLKVTVDDGVVRLEGRVRNLVQEDLVVDVASKVRGIREVERSGFLRETEGISDDAVANAVTRALFEIPKLASSAIKVEARAGIVTLTGTIQSGSFRKEIRALAGALDGVVDVVDRLETPETADEKIQRVLRDLFSPRTTPRFPGKVAVTVASGAVVLEGSVPTLYDKRTAERDVWAINGVRTVDNRLELFSSSAVRVVHP